jgi:hypothetical protein
MNPNGGLVLITIGVRESLMLIIETCLASLIYVSCKLIIYKSKLCG